MKKNITYTIIIGAIILFFEIFLFNQQHAHAAIKHGLTVPPLTMVRTKGLVKGIAGASLNEDPGAANHDMIPLSANTSSDIITDQNTINTFQTCEANVVANEITNGTSDNDWQAIENVLANLKSQCGPIPYSATGIDITFQR